MDAQLQEVLNTGYSTESGRGGRVRYTFTCLSCGKSVSTENQYDSGEEGMIKETMKDQAAYQMSRLFYRIPIVGYFLDRLVYRKISEQRSSGREQRALQGKEEAFREVQGQFNRCSECGRYACSACYSNGLCGICRQQHEARRMAEGAGQTGGEDPTQKKWD